MAKENPYELPSQEIVDNFAEVTAFLGVSGKGSYVRPLAYFESDDFYFWKGVVLARLLNIQPPFSAGQKVTIKPEIKQAIYGYNITGGHLKGFKTVKLDGNLFEIKRVVFLNHRIWLLGFSGENLDLDGVYFNACNFILTPDTKQTV